MALQIPTFLTLFPFHPNSSRKAVCKEDNKRVTFLTRSFPPLRARCASSKAGLQSLGRDKTEQHEKLHAFPPGLQKGNHYFAGCGAFQSKRIIPGYLLLCRVWRSSKASESFQVTYCFAGCGAFLRQANHSRLLTAVQGVALSQGKRIIPGYLLLCRVWRFPKASESSQVTYCCAGCDTFPRQANHPRLLTAVQDVALF